MDHKEAAALYKKGYRVTVVTDTRVANIVSHHKSEIGALTKVVKDPGLWLLVLTEDGFMQSNLGGIEDARERLSYLRREARR